jgi:glycosyltransferase involved in cell wall biosynthesis
MNAAQYIVISPVRNEEYYLPQTIQCMAAQTARPLCWLLVDDGSTDSTGRIIDDAAAQHPWLIALHRNDRGFRQAGGGVMDAFYDGYSQLSALNPIATPGPQHSATPLCDNSQPSTTNPQPTAWSFLVKLDGDLSFSADYFHQCLDRFAADPKLGIGGGTICNRVNGALDVESKIDPAFHVRGATKIYRRACWEQIGGLIRAPGWDTVDEVKANMLGWTTRTFPELILVHHRPAGQAYGQWSNLIKNGRANYVAGYHPLFMLLKCLRRSLSRPFLVEGFGLWLGFVTGYLKRLPQVPDRDVIRYFRRQQMNRLLGKPSLWTQPICGVQKLTPPL